MPDIGPLQASGLKQIDDLIKQFSPNAKGALITSTTFDGKTIDAHLIYKRNDTWYFDFALSQPIKKQLPSISFNTIYVIK